MLIGEFLSNIYGGMVIFLETLANKKLLETLEKASLSLGKPKAAQEIAATLLT
jgi:hypothetical protein